MRSGWGGGSASLRLRGRCWGGAGTATSTMKGLADAAGVTAPTLYNTFGSKDEWLYEAVLGAL